MKPYQQRVINEHTELSEKLRKLGDFMAGEIFQGMDMTEKRLMRQQYAVMGHYKGILNQRIAYFTE